MAHTKRNDTSPQAGKGYPPAEIVEQVLSNQTLELKLRSEELQLRRKAGDNNRSISEAAIAARLEDNEKQRQHIERKSKIYLLAASFFLVVLLVFAAVVIAMGNAELIKDVSEKLVLFLSGFASGIGLNIFKKNGKD